MPSRTYIKRSLISVVAVFGLSCLVMIKGSWEDALHAPWMFPIFIFENSKVTAILGPPFSAAACTLTLLLLAARHNLSAILATVFFSFNIFATIDFLTRYDGHS